MRGPLPATTPPAESHWSHTNGRPSLQKTLLVRKPWLWIVEYSLYWTGPGILDHVARVQIEQFLARCGLGEPVQLIAFAQADECVVGHDILNDAVSRIVAVGHPVECLSAPKDGVADAIPL